MRPCPNCGIAGNNFGCVNHVLPLEGHKSDCPHGQGGRVLCTCDRMTEDDTLDAALGAGRERPET